MDSVYVLSNMIFIPIWNFFVVKDVWDGAKAHSVALVLHDVIKHLIFGVILIFYVRHIQLDMISGLGRLRMEFDGRERR